MSSHDPWCDPPLQEAVFEVRFPTINDYALFAGGMAAAQQQAFPVPKKLPAADLPGMVNIPNVVRHRFETEDNASLFQTGPDVLSVNALQYKGFDHFMQTVESILQSATKFVDLSQLNRLGLRYINQFANVDNPSATLNINQPFQHTDLTKTKFLQLREVKETTDAEIFLSMTIQFPIEPQDLILDIDSFYEAEPKQWDIPVMLDWVKRAHDIIYEEFLAIVSQAEQEARR